MRELKLKENSVDLNVALWKTEQKNISCFSIPSLACSLEYTKQFKLACVEKLLPNKADNFYPLIVDIFLDFLYLKKI